jgi:hypothetical protein
MRYTLRPTCGYLSFLMMNLVMNPMSASAEVYCEEEGLVQDCRTDLS